MSETAKLIHAEAWLEVAEKAQIDPAYKYAIYMSRTLAVKHPELYLQGDALFNQMLRSEDNMGRYYQNRTQDLYQQMEEYKANGRKTGGRFSWSSFSIDDHKPIDYKDIYHTEAFLPFVDIRLHLMAAALKGTDWQATPLSMAEFLYFQNGAKRNSFLLVTDTGTAYVYVPGGLFSKEKLLRYDGEETEQVEGKVVLIFNQSHVWYPLMERDDRAESKILATLVETYAQENAVPELTDIERKIVEVLKANTGFGSTQDKRFGLHYAGKLHTRSWPYYPELFKALYPRDAEAYGFRRSHAPLFVVHRNAHVAWISNLVSPIAAELAAVVRENKDKTYLDQIIAPMVREYMKYVDTGNQRTGIDLWFHPELHCLNLDDNMLTKASNCVYSSANTAAILDLANIEGLEIYIAGLAYENRSSGHAYTVLFKGHEVGTLENGGWMRGFNGLYDPRHFSSEGTVLTAITVREGWVSFCTYSDVGFREINTSLDSKTVQTILEILNAKTRGMTKTGTVYSGRAQVTHKISDFQDLASRMRTRTFEF